jgi:hypothetical protein
MSRQYEQYVDTALVGLTSPIDHYLDGYPFASLLRIEDPGLPTEKHTLISLYDPVVAEIEVLNSNQIKITFSAPFTGYVRFFLGDSTDLVSRTNELQADIDFIYGQLDERVMTTRWMQMNALRDNQLSTLKAELDALKASHESLKNKVDRL